MTELMGGEDEKITGIWAMRVMSYVIEESLHEMTQNCPCLHDNSFELVIES